MLLKAQRDTDFVSSNGFGKIVNWVNALKQKTDNANIVQIFFIKIIFCFWRRQLLRITRFGTTPEIPITSY